VERSCQCCEYGAYHGDRGVIYSREVGSRSEVQSMEIMRRISRVSYGGSNNNGHVTKLRCRCGPIRWYGTVVRVAC
jgi:hypothetical protein